MAFELSREQESRAREAFMAVLDAALPAYELKQLEMFAPREEEFISKEVERKLLVPKLPYGGAREAAWAAKLEEMARSPDWDMRQQRKARAAAKAWREAVGWYYQRRPLSEKMHKEELKWLRDIRDAAHAAGEWDHKWFAEMLIEGLPDLVADFQIVPLYLLVKPDGTHDRLVRLRNVLGEKAGPVALPPRDFHASEYFRNWCLSHGNFSWQKGRDELMKLHLDVNRAVAWRRVYLVEAIGWHAVKTETSPEGRKVSGIWFLGDCAYVNGQRLAPDEDGIYWHDGEGYMVPKVTATAYFTQRFPMFFPEVTASSLDLSVTPENRNFFREFTDLSPDALAVAQLFREMGDRLRRTMGGLEAWLVLGGFASYAAAPEMFEEYSQFPGLWLHGQAGSGKSTIVEWLMSIWGFQVHGGLTLKSDSVSAVGLLEEANRYSNLPLWADEFKQDAVDPKKVGVLHNAFNRSGQVKWNPDNVQRVMRTVFVVSGESTANEAALRGRYAHVQVSAMRREKDAEGKDVNHAVWFASQRKHFYQIGRFLIEHREEFVERTRSIFQTWRENSQGVSERDKLVYGVPYAAFRALALLLRSHSGEEIAAFRQFVIGHAGEASEDVNSDLNINIFWTELLNAYKAGEVPRGCFRVECTQKAHAPQRPEQVKCGQFGQERGWRSYTLYMDPSATLSALQLFLTKQRASIPLKQKDLRDQLSKNPYWKNGPHAKRFNLDNSGAGVTKGWCIELDTHPMGYQMVSDEDYDRYIHPDSVTGDDPRMGELYLIVNEVWAKEVKRED